MKIKKIINLAGFLSLVYSVGTIFGAGFLLFRATRRIKILHPERLPEIPKEGFLVVVNHRSLIDPFVILSLFLPKALLHPLRSVPFNTPDARNFYQPWYFAWIKPFAIPIYRNAGGIKKVISLIKIKRLLKKGKRVILFPEGGRTHKGVKFFYSAKGEKIRKLAEGAGWLAVKTGVPVIPVWLSGTDEILPNTGFTFLLRFWKKSTIKIGHPLRFSGKDYVKATEDIQKALLDLADE